MSQATDLLNSLTEDQISAYLNEANDEPHIVIGSDRFITIPNSLKRIAVQHDHDVETVTFDCPRYWDNLDMSKMAVYINYILSNGYSDSYPVSDVTEDGDLMHFTWTISRNVTQVAGKVTFLVCIKKTDVDGTEVNHWNSEISRDMQVSEGMETEEQVAMENTDLVTQLLLRMSAVEQINITSETMEAYVNRIDEIGEAVLTARDRVWETSDHIDESAAEIRNSYANAIKGTVSGEVVQINDVSPLEHDITCCILGDIIPTGLMVDNGVDVAYYDVVDNTVTIRSISPTMTVFTNTPGAIIEVTYNRDTTKMFESYVLTDRAKYEIAGLVADGISAEIDAIGRTLDEIIALQENLL